MTHTGDEETEHSELMKRNTMGMRETIMYRKETTTERVKFAKYFMLPPPMHFPTQKPKTSTSRETRTVVIESLHAQTAVLTMMGGGRNAHIAHGYT